MSLNLQSRDKLPLDHGTLPSDRWQTVDWMPCLFEGVRKISFHHLRIVKAILNDLPMV